MPPVLDKMKRESEALKRELSERTLAFVTGGLGLVAGLAWNDAIKAAIEYFFPLEKDSLPAKFVYAGIISLVVVVLSMYLVRLLKREEEKKQ